ncbi:MAG: response regulator [Synergistaceae bacterium]|jgi:CheY-like chemotaxis protein|nr:response regulator [Synergistaceae bacterium]
MSDENIEYVRKVILAVDDEATNLTRINMILGDEFDVRLSNSVQKGLFMLTQVRFDLILLDIEMPGKNGFDFLESMRTSYAAYSAPVIIVTAMATPALIANVAKLGVTNFVVKPFAPATLRERVYAMIGRGVATPIVRLDAPQRGGAASRGEGVSRGESVRVEGVSMSGPAATGTGEARRGSRGDSAREEDYEPLIERLEFLEGACLFSNKEEAEAALSDVRDMAESNPLLRRVVNGVSSLVAAGDFPGAVDKIAALTSVLKT